MEGVEAKAIGAVSVGGIAAICAAPNLANAFGITIQAELPVLSVAQPDQPGGDLLLLRRRRSVNRLTGFAPGRSASRVVSKDGETKGVAKDRKSTESPKTSPRDKNTTGHRRWSKSRGAHRQASKSRRRGKARSKSRGHSERSKSEPWSGRRNRHKSRGQRKERREKRRALQAKEADEAGHAASAESKGALAMWQCLGRGQDEGEEGQQPSEIKLLSEKSEEESKTLAEDGGGPPDYPALVVTNVSNLFLKAGEDMHEDHYRDWKPRTVFSSPWAPKPIRDEAVAKRMAIAVLRVADFIGKSEYKKALRALPIFATMTRGVVYPENEEAWEETSLPEYLYYFFPTIVALKRAMEIQCPTFFELPVPKLEDLVSADTPNPGGIGRDLEATMSACQWKRPTGPQLGGLVKNPEPDPRVFRLAVDEVDLSTGTLRKMLYPTRLLVDHALYQQDLGDFRNDPEASSINYHALPPPKVLADDKRVLEASDIQDTAL